MFIEITDSEIFNRPVLVNINHITKIERLTPSAIDPACCFIGLSSKSYLKTSISFEKIKNEITNMTNNQRG